ncbi:uncharacterized protein BDV17DRAFT_292254 [Aspergillus undulatus]|uniref:uncharacterized protein n=1 Tax=Aspergillus undulatus TaxID=1810928 RepID=UPI003CCD7B30
MPGISDFWIPDENPVLQLLGSPTSSEPDTPQEPSPKRKRQSDTMQEESPPTKKAAQDSMSAVKQATGRINDKELERKAVFERVRFTGARLQQELDGIQILITEIETKNISADNLLHCYLDPFSKVKQFGDALLQTVSFEEHASETPGSIISEYLVEFRKLVDHMKD